jgi:mRNA-degrading endonuclease HigB of HigAB toxin-antitoxin module
MKPFRFRAFVVFAVLSMVAMLVACAGQQSQTASTDTAAEENPFANEAKLAKSYANLVIADYTAPAEILRDYPDDLKASRDAAVTALVQGGKYRSVGVSESVADSGPTLIVKTNVPTMRIVGFNARFWGGAFAGNSEMILEMMFIDQQTGAEMGHKTLTSNVNVMGATWSFGASDRSLPTDMGSIMAAYLQTVVPGVTP